MWHDVWHLQISVGEKVFRSVVVYLFLLVAFRIAGKRELGQATTLDLAVLLLVANAIQNGIIGDDLSVTGALIGATTLFCLNALFARGTFHWAWLSRLFEGDPTVLIEEGKVNRRALHRELISLPELRSMARRQGFADLGEVHFAMLETNGTVSMFKQDEPAIYHPDEAIGLRIGKHRRRPPRSVSR